MKPEDCPPLPPTRMRHRGDKINPQGRVSALCFPKPRAIDMKRATWVMSDDAVTCPKCRALILARHEPPNARVQAGTTAPQPDPERDEAARRGASPGTKC